MSVKLSNGYTIRARTENIGLAYRLARDRKEYYIQIKNKNKIIETEIPEKEYYRVLEAINEH